MTLVVLLVLAGIWAAVLVPPMLRVRSEGRPADSIGNFRHQLRVLQRAGPTAVAADSLQIPSYSPNRRPTYHMARQVSPEHARRARTLKRRRDVFAALLAGMTGTLVLGLLPSFRALLGLHLVLDLACIGYVAMLVRMRNAAAEREMKLRFLPATAQPDNVVMLRRSAN